MKKTAVLQATHKKCFKCGYTTSDLNAATCKCDGFLYMVSQIYSPKVASKKSK